MGDRERSSEIKKLNLDIVILYIIVLFLVISLFMNTVNASEGFMSKIMLRRLPTKDQRFKLNRLRSECANHIKMARYSLRNKKINAYNKHKQEAMRTKNALRNLVLMINKGNGRIIKSMTITCN